MSTKHSLRFRDDMNGDRIEPVLTIRVEGSSDVFRLAEVLRRAQCDFAEHGTSIQNGLRRKWGADRHDTFFRRLTGHTYRGR